ncbi:MAG: hypothetical protein RIS85_2608 [Pseudomonadota bacterium]|jgi:hypothetical protein
MRLVAAAAVLAGMVSAAPVQAQQCLDRETLAAARVQEFGTMMMAVSLRCRAIGVDIAPGYEAMLGAHQRTFAAADRRLRSFYAAQNHAFDRYSTQLGNRYGGGATDPANCRRFEHVASDLAANPDVASLGRVALAMVAQPRVEGPVCPRP